MIDIKNLKYRLMEKGLKQKDIAEKMNLSELQINRLLNEKQNMTIVQYNKLEGLLNQEV